MKAMNLTSDARGVHPLLVAVAVIVIVIIIGSLLYTMTIGFGCGGAGYMPVPSPTPLPIAPNPSPQPIGDGASSTQGIIGDNQFAQPPLIASEKSESTFGADVDTGSYVYMRNCIKYGVLPEPENVRAEEFLNYFDYHYTKQYDETFKVYAECGQSSFGEGLHMLKVGIRAKSVSTEEREPMTLIAVIDISGSMEAAGKLDLIKQVLPYLVDQLVQGDRFGMVVYESTAHYHLEPVGVERKDVILTSIRELKTAGSTNAQDGLIKGYEMAAEFRREGESSRLLLFSDGVANTGVYDIDGLVKEIQRYKAMGIYLSTYGFGMGEYNDQLMEQLADNGDGKYGYIDSLEEAKRELVEDVSGTLVTVARDLKLKMVFNPSVVEEYRLIGYDNRIMTSQEFENYSKDSGDIGAGHTVTALYELKLKEDFFISVEKTIATLEMRYKEPDTGVQQFLNATIRTGDNQEHTSPQFRFALCVAEFAEYLEGSEYCTSTVKEITQVAEKALSEYICETVTEKEFVDLLKTAQTLV
jgi:Ca-activated chloride channel family protein